MNSRTQDSVAEAVKQARDVSVSAVSSVFDAVTDFVPDLPNLPFVGTPQPKQLTAQALDFALSLYKIQSDYAVRIAEVLQRLASRVSAAVEPLASKVADLRHVSS